jgi:hypothetical protein
MMVAAAVPSPFTEHGASLSKASRLSTAAFQIRSTLVNLPTGNCRQAGTRPCPLGEDSARMACAVAARVLSSLSEGR